MCLKYHRKDLCGQALFLVLWDGDYKVFAHNMKSKHYNVYVIFKDSWFLKRNQRCYLAVNITKECFGKITYFPTDSSFEDLLILIPLVLHFLTDFNEWFFSFKCGGFFLFTM